MAAKSLLSDSDNRECFKLRRFSVSGGGHGFPFSRPQAVGGQTKTLGRRELGVNEPTILVGGAHKSDFPVHMGAPTRRVYHDVLTLKVFAFHDE